MDSACTVKLNYDILPIFYRVHSHSIMSVISGYLIRDDKEWIELGRYSPKQPQVCTYEINLQYESFLFELFNFFEKAFYPVTHTNEIVHQGDYLASRCTANSMDRNSTTYTG